MNGLGIRRSRGHQGKDAALLFLEGGIADAQKTWKIYQTFVIILSSRWASAVAAHGVFNS